MKSSIIKVSNIDLKCISAKRGLDICNACKRVEICKCPEAVAGRIITAGQRIYHRNVKIKELTNNNIKDEQKL